MPGQCSTSARAKKLCDYLHFVPGCAPESSAFLWPHRSRMLLLPSSVASTRSSWVAENSQLVIMYTTILLAAALQDWERYSTHALAARDVAATLAKGVAQQLHVLSVY